MLRENRCLAALILLAALLSRPAAAGSEEIYQWRDGNGVLHFTDTPPPVLPYQPMGAAEPETFVPPVPAGSEQVQAIAAKPVGGMFWKVEGTNTRTSYILGTIHSEDERVVGLTDPVERALEGADSLIMEMVPDAAAMIKAAAAMLYLDGRSLKATVGDALFQRTVQALSNYGIPAMAADRMKPWAVMATLSVPRPKTGRFLDMVLYQRALALGKPVFGLETPEEQVAVFEGIPERDQVVLLEQTIDELPRVAGMLEEITQAYVRGDLEGISELSKMFIGSDNPGLADRFMQRLNEDRNQRMAERLRPRLSSGNLFVAVGALHLTGENGLLRLLEKGGFQVSPAPL